MPSSVLNVVSVKLIPSCVSKLFSRSMVCGCVWAGVCVCVCVFRSMHNYACLCVYQIRPSFTVCLHSQVPILNGCFSTWNILAKHTQWIFSYVYILLIRVPFLPCFGYLVHLQATPRFYLTLVPVFRRRDNFTRKHIACQPSLEWHSCCYLIRKQPCQNCVVCSIVKWMKKWKIFTAPHELTTVNKFSSCSMKATLLHPNCLITPKNPTASLPSVANIWK